jgi:hypothetical protein
VSALNDEKLLRFTSYGLMVVVCGYIFYSLAQFVFVKNIALFSVASPLVFAFLLGIVLLVCLLINAFSEFKTIKEIETGEKHKTLEGFQDLLKVLAAVGLLIVYVSLMRRFSFRPATIGYLFLTMFLLNQLTESKTKKIIKAAAAALITVPVLYYIFNGIFLVMLP